MRRTLGLVTAYAECTRETESEGNASTGQGTRTEFEGGYSRMSLLVETELILVGS